MPRSSPLLLSPQAFRSVRRNLSLTRTMTPNGPALLTLVPTTRPSPSTSTLALLISGSPTHPSALDVQESTPTLPLPLPLPSPRVVPSPFNMVMVPPSPDLSSRIPVSLQKRSSKSQFPHISCSVTVAGVKATSQTFSAVTSLSDLFSDDPIDGILGLAFQDISNLNAVRLLCFYHLSCLILTSHAGTVLPERFLRRRCPQQRLRLQARFLGL